MVTKSDRDKSLKEKVHELKMNHIAKVVKRAVDDQVSVIGEVARDLDCSWATAQRAVNDCKKSGLLEGVDIRPGGIKNTGLIRLARELNLDVETVREAVLKCGGRVTASPRKKKD